MPWSRPILIVLLSFAFPTCLAGADQPGSAVLHLLNDGYTPGQMLTSDDPKTIRWRSPYFTEPLVFPLEALSAVHYPQPDRLPRPQGEYCFELVGDDVIYGDLLGLSADAVQVDSPRFGKVNLRRDSIQRFYRWHGEELIYLGPMGLDGWNEQSSTPQWRDTGGMPTTDKPGATIYGDFGIPEKAVIEFDLSWKRKPNFMFALGVGSKASDIEEAFRFEVWHNQVVAIAESKQDADVTSVMRVSSDPGRLRVQAYLDQQRRLMLLYSPAGSKIASVSIKLGERRVSPGLRLTHKEGELRLERLRISRWDGVPPGKFQADKARLHRTDGSIVYGQLTGFDPSSKRFTVVEEEAEVQLRADAVTDVFLAGAAAAPDSGADDSSAEPPDVSLRVVYNDGSRLTGTPISIDEGRVTFRAAAVQESLQLPAADRRSMVAPPHKAPEIPRRKERAGRLELESLRLKGRLVDGDGQTDASCLVWLPDFALNASPLQPGTNGRVVYRETKPRRRVAQNQRANRRASPFGATFKRMMKFDLPADQSKKQRSALHLRSGDTIPCSVTRIDDQGVTFSTPLSSATFVPHTALKAIEFDAQRSVLNLDKEARNQLLTLPRLLRDAPPLHLACSRNADFLRGRILEMDDQVLKIEVRLETKEIPRDRLANLIWFHADELTGELPAESGEADQAATRVQTVRPNGNRLTFVAEKLHEQSLHGNSEILGECQVDLAQVDQLLFGRFIEKASADLVFHRWKLKHAKDPKFVDAAGAPAAAPTGTDSPLVGEPAPDFRLDLLDGEKFELSKYRGRVVVLDFWATWCGPCLQTMPIVDQVVAEFAGQGIELIAVNLEEQPGQITSMLDRHKLEMSVALDRDGVVATRYAVTAIPQTVIIDREGRVARLFVGGGVKLEEPLREALHELVSPVDAAF